MITTTPVQVDGFWDKVMPVVAGEFDWASKLIALGDKKAWEKGLKQTVRKLDNEEFNLFLAKVVMTAASKQIMGVDLTRRIEFLKSLRG